MALHKSELASSSKRKVEDLDASSHDSVQQSKKHKTDYEQWKKDEKQRIEDKTLMERAILPETASFSELLENPDVDYPVDKSDYLDEDGHLLDEYADLLDEDNKLVDDYGRFDEDEDLAAYYSWPNFHPMDAFTPAGRPWGMIEPDAVTPRRDRKPPLMDRLQSFLPAMAAANQELEGDEGKRKGRMAVEIAKEDESEGNADGKEMKEEEEEGKEKAGERQHVEMTLALGVLEDKKMSGGGEQDGDSQGGEESKADEKDDSDVVGVRMDDKKTRKVGIEVLGSATD